MCELRVGLVGLGDEVAGQVLELEDTQLGHDGIDGCGRHFLVHRRRHNLGKQHIVHLFWI